MFNDSASWRKEPDGSYSSLYLSSKLRAWKTERLGWHSEVTYPDGRTQTARTGARTFKEVRGWAEQYALSDFGARVKGKEPSGSVELSPHGDLDGMTVRDMIEMLEEYPSDARIVAEDEPVYGYGGWTDKTRTVLKIVWGNQ